LTWSDALATEDAGRELARAIVATAVESLLVFLRGPRGAGKTTFVRGALVGLGHDGRVPSPTYALIEPYLVSGFTVYHIDLYRLESQSEILELGLDELLAGPRTLAFIEWPERAASVLQAPDLDLLLELCPAGRALVANGATVQGQRVVDAWMASPDVGRKA
jgi:tRNA threonylcarbamoyladenosine biosynthesis protein TsaE